MHLEKLKIRGFKSFAKDTELFFSEENKENKGLTVIVGPNGSGKSNISDAVRWTLGEQSMKHLRGRKSEDVIFHGSSQKSKLSMAEVSLYLKNFSSTNLNALQASFSEDCQKKLNLNQISEISITRRLYRNGESEYLINNIRVRLADIQMLLAQASFGQKTYSVIGQGMVDSFLSGSLADRKEFFDEATGVKQFQIKRDDSLNKLRKSYENLNQVNMLLVEIEPRLQSLTRQMKKLERRSGLETELRDLQSKYYNYHWHKLNNNFNANNTEYLEKEKLANKQKEKLERLKNELTRFEQESITGDLNIQKTNLAQQEKEAHNIRNNLFGKLARLDARLEARFESEGKFDLSWLNQKKESIQRELEEIEKNINQFNLNALNEKLKNFLNSRQGLEKKLEKFAQEINNLEKEEEKLARNETYEHQKEQINTELKKYLELLRTAELENNLEKLKNLINQIKIGFTEILGKIDTENKLTQISRDKTKLQKEIIILKNEKENLSEQSNKVNLEISAQNERIKLLQVKKNQLSEELQGIESKIKQSQDQKMIETEREKENIKIQIKKQDALLLTLSKQVEDLNTQEEEKKTRIFAIQKEIERVQTELNQVNNELNNLRVASARLETKLENLEAEIRVELKSMEEIKRQSDNIDQSINWDDLECREIEKIKNIKKQLELIGGIDPETKKEYEETKERYDFLSGQVDDLTRASRSLEKIIRELDVQIKEKFDRKFKIISKKFNEYFKILFEGGEAKIEKIIAEDEEDEDNDRIKQEDQESVSQENPKSEIKNDRFVDVNKVRFLKKHNATGLAGIEIQANPPGKKISSVSILSGGERALTAIALICAIISSSPAPFVFLDEVDAALDEANSMRLARILDDLSTQTQFIVITHNRALMNKASILYGVTMRDDGISKLLSIKLEDAKAAR